FGPVAPYGRGGGGGVPTLQRVPDATPGDLLLELPDGDVVVVGRPPLAPPDRRGHPPRGPPWGRPPGEWSPPGPPRPLGTRTPPPSGRPHGRRGPIGRRARALRLPRRRRRMRRGRGSLPSGASSSWRLPLSVVKR